MIGSQGRNIGFKPTGKSLKTSHPSDGSRKEIKGKEKLRSIIEPQVKSFDIFEDVMKVKEEEVR